MHCTTSFMNIRYVKIRLSYEIEPIITENRNQIDTLFESNKVQYLDIIEQHRLK